MKIDLTMPSRASPRRLRKIARAEEHNGQSVFLGEPFKVARLMIYDILEQIPQNATWEDENKDTLNPSSEVYDEDDTPKVIETYGGETFTLSELIKKATETHKDSKGYSDLDYSDYEKTRKNLRKTCKQVHDEWTPAWLRSTTITVGEADFYKPDSNFLTEFSDWEIRNIRRLAYKVSGGVLWPKQFRDSDDECEEFPNLPECHAAPLRGFANILRRNHKRLFLESVRLELDAGEPEEREADCEDVSYSELAASRYRSSDATYFYTTFENDMENTILKGCEGFYWTNWESRIQVLLRRPVLTWKEIEEYTVQDRALDPSYSRAIKVEDEREFNEYGRDRDGFGRNGYDDDGNSLKDFLASGLEIADYLKQV